MPPAQQIPAQAAHKKIATDEAQPTGRAFVNSEIKRWAAVVKTSGAKLD